MYTELELGRFHTNGASQGRGWWHRTVQHSGTHMEVPEGAYCKREREYTPHMSMSNVSTAKPLSPSLQFFYRRNSAFLWLPCHTVHRCRRCSHTFILGYSHVKNTQKSSGLESYDMYFMWSQIPFTVLYRVLYHHAHEMDSKT